MRLWQLDSWINSLDFIKQTFHFYMVWLKLSGFNFFWNKHEENTKTCSSEMELLGRLWSWEPRTWFKWIVCTVCDISLFIYSIAGITNLLWKQARVMVSSVLCSISNTFLKQNHSKLSSQSLYFWLLSSMWLATLVWLISKSKHFKSWWRDGITK